MSYSMGGYYRYGPSGAFFPFAFCAITFVQKQFEREAPPILAIESSSYVDSWRDFVFLGKCDISVANVFLFFHELFDYYCFFFKTYIYVYIYIYVCHTALLTVV